MRSCFFVVSSHNGILEPAIYWDELPRAPIRNLEYVLRLDELSNAEKLVNTSLRELLVMYLKLRARNKLPPRYEPPIKK